MLFRSFLACAFAALPAIASAQSVPQVDLSAGYMGSSDRSGSMTGIATLHGPGIGVVGLHPQVSFAFPFSSGANRYALTAEGVLPVTIHHTYLGGGRGGRDGGDFRGGRTAARGDRDSVIFPADQSHGYPNAGAGEAPIYVVVEPLVMRVRADDRTRPDSHMSEPP